MRIGEWFISCALTLFHRNVWNRMHFLLDPRGGVQFLSQPLKRIGFAIAETVGCELHEIAEPFCAQGS